MGNILDWFRERSIPIKVLLCAGLMIIIANLILIVYAKGVLESDRKGALLERSSTMSNNSKQGIRHLSELEYENEFVDHYERWISVSSFIIYATQNPKNPSSLLSRELAIKMTQIKTLANQVEQISPPKQHELTHKTYLKAISDYRWISNNLPEAINTGSADRISSCRKKLNHGNSALKEALNYLKQGL